MNTSTPSRIKHGGFARTRQRGAALVEFSLILIAMFTLFYGIIVYSIVFVTQQAVAYAAESGADAIVAADPATVECDPTNETIINVVRVRVTNLLRFLPDGAATEPVVTFPDTLPVSGCQLVVTVTYPFSNWGFLVTGLLPLPNRVTGAGVVSTQLPAPAA